MITLQEVGNTRVRTFGWVQNPSNFRSLCNVVAIFDFESPIHKKLRNTIIPSVVTPENGQAVLITAMDARPLKISYLHLVGTGRSERATAPCNALVQAIVHGQGIKPYTDNWTADGFVRWAHCLGFIEYDYSDDTFSITESGLSLSASDGDGDELTRAEHRILVDAMLSYPPAIRVLTLLSEENAHLTKFEIGRQLGFTGEGGFTSMPQNIFIRSLAGITDNGEKTNMRNNWEGSSDKYARMIASWLTKLGLLDRVAKNITVFVGAEKYTETVGQAFVITAKGLTALHRANGASRHHRIAKTVCYEMLATKGSDREFLRKRRSLIIKALCIGTSPITIERLITYLASYDIVTTKEVVRDDIQGLINIGIDIHDVGELYHLHDRVKDFVIPIRTGVTQSTIERAKDELRERITQLPHDYLSLLDLAYDSTQNRLFEMKTLQLLTEECGYKGLHLGGSRKPDGIIFTNGSVVNNYGVIIDTKSYSGGYNLPISQADEMQRYVQENQRRDERENPNKWWENFGNNVSRFYFMFVSGHFTGRYQEQIDRIKRITDTNGAAVEIYKLLLMVNDNKNNAHALANAENFLFHTQA